MGNLPPPPPGPDTPYTFRLTVTVKLGAKSGGLPADIPVGTTWTLTPSPGYPYLWYYNDDNWDISLIWNGTDLQPQINQYDGYDTWHVFDQIEHLPTGQTGYMDNAPPPVELENDADGGQILWETILLSDDLDDQTAALADALGIAPPDGYKWEPKGNAVSAHSTNFASPADGTNALVQYNPSGLPGPPLS